MARLVLYLIVALVLAVGIGWLADNPGHVSVTWKDWQLESSLAVLLLFTLVIFIAVVTALVLWSKARRELPFVGANRELRRRERGLSDLERAAILLAKGDAKGALTLIERAEGALPAQTLVQLYAAQASLSAGNIDAARGHFQSLAEQKETEILGLRGLLDIASQGNRQTEALTLAAQIWAIEPKSIWATNTLFQLLIRAGDWAQAEEVLRQLIKLNALDDAAGQSLMAVVIFEAAREADLAGRPDAARKQLAKALKIDRGLVPAAILAARLEGSAGKPSAAEKIISAAWAACPHPDLADAYARLGEKETPGERYRRFKILVEVDPKQPFGRLALAERALAVEHYEEVAELLKPLLQSPYQSEALTMMAEVERGKGGPDAEHRAGSWLDQITKPDAGPSWACSQCGAASLLWVNRCGTCGAFASQKWHQPGAGPKPQSLPIDEVPGLALLPEALETRVDVATGPDPEQD